MFLPMLSAQGNGLTTLAAHAIGRRLAGWRQPREMKTVKVPGSDAYTVNFRVEFRLSESAAKKVQAAFTVVALSRLPQQLTLDPPEPQRLMGDRIGFEAATFPPTTYKPQ
jgi:hypothetical protein